MKTKTVKKLTEADKIRIDTHMKKMNDYMYYQNIKRHSGKNPQIEDLFIYLRTQGYFAEQKYYDCNSCGLSEIPKQYKNKFVFYHEQDYEQLKEEGSCYLSYPNVKCGNEIKEVFEEVGFKVDWNGDINKKILITLPSKPEKTLKEVVQSFGHN